MFATFVLMVLCVVSKNVQANQSGQNVDGSDMAKQRYEMLKMKDPEMFDMLTHLQEEIVKIKSLYNEIKKENGEIKQNNDHLRANQVQIRKAYSTIQKENSALKQDNSKLLTNFKILESKISDYEDKPVQHSPIKQLQANFIGFTAKAIEERIYNDDDVVQFPVVVTNYGDGYQPGNGTFVCPVTGYYMFTVAFLATNSYRMGGDLFVDDFKLFVLLAEDYVSYDQASATGVVLCNTGQTVRFQSNTDGARMWGNSFSSFSGALLSIEA